MPLLDLISLSFSSFIFLSLFLSPFSLLFLFSFFSFFQPLFACLSSLFSLPLVSFFSLYLCFSHSLPSVSPRDPAISLYTMVRCALAFKHLAAFSRSRPRMKGMSSDALGPLYAFFFFFLQLRPPQRTPRFLAEATVPATFVVHHATSSSPARSSRATEKPMLASTAAPWQHPLRSYHVRRRPVTHDRVRFIH